MRYYKQGSCTKYFDSCNFSGMVMLIPSILEVEVFMLFFSMLASKYSPFKALCITETYLSMRRRKIVNVFGVNFAPNICIVVNLSRITARCELCNLSTKKILNAMLRRAPHPPLEQNGRVMHIFRMKYPVLQFSFIVNGILFLFLFFIEIIPKNYVVLLQM